MDAILFLTLLFVVGLAYLLLQTTESGLNRWVDRNLPLRGWRKPKNWFGASRFINNASKIDEQELFLDVLCLMVFLVIFTLAQQYTNLILTGAIYSILILLMLFFWNGRKSKSLPYIGFGPNLHENMRLGALVGIVWVVVSILLSSMTQQTIATPAQAISPLLAQSLLMQLAIGVITVLVISYVEGTVFAGNILPLFSSKIGIILAIILVSCLGGMLHYVILDYNAFSIGLTILRGLMVYPLVLKEQSKAVELVAHPVGNLVAFLLSFF